jgi:hypothetical protein
MLGKPRSTTSTAQESSGTGPCLDVSRFVAALLIAGKLYRWDTSSGRTTAIATGQGAVRRMHFAPPASAVLPFNPSPHLRRHLKSYYYAASVCCVNA